MDFVVALAIVAIVLVAAVLGRLLYLRWRVESIAPTEAAERLRDAGSVLVLDVRQPGEYAGGHIRGSISAPGGILNTETKARLTRADQVVVVCERGNRSLSAANTLLGQGHRHVVNLRGGMQAWERAGLPAERGQPRGRRSS
jgi:rhodanese-related sulfurtransferase